MKLYAIFWASIFVGQITQTAFWVAIYNIKDGDSLTEKRLYASMPAFGMLDQISTCCLDMLVLLSYHKFGRKISKQAETIVTHEL